MKDLERRTCTEQELGLHETSVTPSPHKFLLVVVATLQVLGSVAVVCVCVLMCWIVTLQSDSLNNYIHH